MAIYRPTARKANEYAVLQWYAMKIAYSCGFQRGLLPNMGVCVPMLGMRNTRQREQTFPAGYHREALNYSAPSCKGV